MATTRTVMTPDGDVIHVTDANQTVMTPAGGVINADITAAGGGYPMPLHHHYQVNIGCQISIDGDYPSWRDKINADT